MRIVPAALGPTVLVRGAAELAFADLLADPAGACLAAASAASGSAGGAARR